MINIKKGNYISRNSRKFYGPFLDHQVVHSSYLPKLILKLAAITDIMAQKGKTNTPKGEYSSHFLKRASLIKEIKRKSITGKGGIKKAS